MRRTGARLTLSSAMSQQTHLDPINMGDSKSSSLAKIERENKLLKQENAKLKSELVAIRSMYNQLVQENAHEKFDERRVLLLKSQVIQLERQLLLFSESLSSRTETLFEVENNLQWLADKCRLLINKDVRGPQVPVERSDLVLMVETTESARIKLYKQIENKSKENLSKPLQFFSDFLSVKGKDLTFLDVASGNLEHINLKHVSKLESKLSSLYKDLIQLHAAMETEENNDSAYLWSSGHVTTAARERHMTQILKTCANMKDCCSDLLELSLLYPSAPWPPIRKCALKEITADKVLACLPAKLRQKSGDTSLLIQSLVKAYNYKVYMLQNQNKSIREEVKYHQKVYNLQLKYTESLFQAIREAYSSFEDSSNELIVKPLNVVLESYIDLSQSASDVSLKKFLHVFKEQVPHLTNIVETLDVNGDTESEGSKVLSQYGEEFFQALEKLVRVEQSRRDVEASRIEEVRTEQSRLDKELREILDEQEAKWCCPEPELMSPSSENVVTNPDISRSTESRKQTEKNFGDKGDSACDNYESFHAPKKVKSKVKEKSIHQKEWVNILDDEPVLRDMSDLCLENKDIDIKDSLSNAEIFDMHKTSDRVEIVYQDSKDCENIQVDMDNSDISTGKVDKPAVKKKKPAYIPNTFVPNRTLQLRRSGSLSRLSGRDSTLDNEESINKQVPHEVKSEKSRKSAQHKQTSKSRPAFR